MLQVDNLNQYYGGSHILRNLAFDAKAGEVTVILGRNGVGKTTLLKSLMGVVPVKTGSVKLGGADITRATPYERARSGIGYVPQGREIFGRLTVEENLRMGLAWRKAGTPIPAELFELFPVLKQMLGRRGGDLSGGQQQQLAIARALAAGPKLLLLDEPTEGIQPSIIKELAKTLNQIKAERKLSIILAEQVLSFALEISDRFVIIEKGEFVYEGARASVDEARIHSYLTV